MKIKEIIRSIEKKAPLSLQESYDNAGLQVGDTEVELRGVMISLDITEEVIDEAIRKDCNLIVSHHPLLFKGLKTVSDQTYQQRCVVKAIKNDITLYSAHTNLDNADNGVNHMMSRQLGLNNLRWLEAKGVLDGVSSGSGLVGDLPEAMDTVQFLKMVKDKFGVECLLHSKITKDTIKTVALCGGSGSFLISKAEELGADCFITGEISYHSFFETGTTMAVSIGHYQSEKYTEELLKEMILQVYSDRVLTVSFPTNAINYL